MLSISFGAHIVLQQRKRVLAVIHLPLGEGQDEGANPNEPSTLPSPKGRGSIETRLLFFVELVEKALARELIDNRIILKRIQCYAFLTHEFQDRLHGFGFSSRYTI